METIVQDIPDDYTLVKELLLFLNEKDFNDSMENFIKENCDRFDDGIFHQRALESQEHDAEAYELYLEYVDKVDRQLDRFCKRQDMTHSEVMRELKRASDDNSLCANLLEMLLAATEFPLFMCQMSCMKSIQPKQREGKYSDESGTRKRSVHK